MNAKLQGYRTYIVSGVAFLAAAANFIVAVSQNLGPLDAQASGSVMVMAILFAIMRTITSTPPGKLPGLSAPTTPATPPVAPKPPA